MRGLTEHNRSSSSSSSMKGKVVEYDSDEKEDHRPVVRPLLEGGGGRRGGGGPSSERNDVHEDDNEEEKEKEDVVALLEEGAVDRRENPSSLTVAKSSSPSPPHMDGADDKNDGATMMPQHFLTVQGHPIYFQEDWGAGIGGGLWSTGLALAKYMDTHHAFQTFSDLWVERLRRRHSSSSSNTSSSVAPTPPGGLRVLELGSGNGLLSSCWLALARSIIASCSIVPVGDNNFHHQLVVTDTRDHLELIRTTIMANSHLHVGTAAIQVLEYEWGTPWPPVEPVKTTVAAASDESQPPSCGRPTATTTTEGLPTTFDIIFGSDVAYRPELYDPLIASFKILSNMDTRICLGVTMADTCPDFFQRLTREGFVYRRLDDEWLEPEFQGLTFGIFVVQRHVPWTVLDPDTTKK